MTTPFSPMAQNPPEGGSNKKQHYLTKWVLYLSVPQVIFGIICIIFQIVLVESKTEQHFVGQGIWAGLVFTFAGVLGIVSSQKKSTGTIISFLVMSIISATLTVGLLAPSAIEWADYADRQSHRNYDYHYYNDAVYYTRRYTTHYYTTRPTTPDPGRVAIPLNALMVFIAVLQAVLAIMSSAFACHGLCGGRKTNRNQFSQVVGQVQLVAGSNGQQQMMIIPMTQQGAALQAAGVTMPTGGFSIQPPQPPSYGPSEPPPPEYKAQEAMSPQNGEPIPTPQGYVTDA